MSNPLIGTFLHAVGGVSASSCYLPSNKVKQWSWGSFWLVQSLFAWIIMPLIIGYLTVPGFFSILSEAPAHAFWWAFVLGGVYGFGSMAFGMSIRYIGYSLTYTIAIGISAILGTVLPLFIFGGLNEYFSNPSGTVVLMGMIVSMIGVSLCGWAGFRREKELLVLQQLGQKKVMLTGLFLSLFAGILSAVFNISLEFGQPIADLAAQNGADHFQGNAKLIVSTAGCWVINTIWFVVVGIRSKNLNELVSVKSLGIAQYSKNVTWSALAGSMWFLQFFFYGLGHVNMGKFQYASWVLHMSMLIFFSYIIGVLMKEWKQVSIRTYVLLIFALLVLILSFGIISWGSMMT